MALYRPFCPGCQHDETHRRPMCTFHRHLQDSSDSEREIQVETKSHGFRTSEAGPVAQADVENCEEAQLGLKCLLVPGCGRTR